MFNFATMNYHLEIIKICSTTTKSFCRIYLYDNNCIKQVINLNIKNFTNLRKSEIKTDNGFNLVLDDKQLNIEEWNLNLMLNSVRICTFKVGETTKQYSNRLVDGDICEKFLQIIDLDNRKLKDRIF